MIYILLVISVIAYVFIDRIYEDRQTRLIGLLRKILFITTLVITIIMLFGVLTSCKPQQSMLRVEKKTYVNVSCPTYPVVKHRLPEWWMKIWNPDKCPKNQR